MYEVYELYDSGGLRRYMGTEFKIIEDGESGAFLELSEHSCKLDLYAYMPNGKVQFNIIEYITPEQVRDAAINMIKAASYFVKDPKTFKYETQELINKI